MTIGAPKGIKFQQPDHGVNHAGEKPCRPFKPTHHAFAQRDADTDQDDFLSAGILIISSSYDVFAKLQLIVKVKEAKSEESARLKKSQPVLAHFIGVNDTLLP